MPETVPPLQRTVIAGDGVEYPAGTVLPLDVAQTITSPSAWQRYGDGVDAGQLLGTLPSWAQSGLAYDGSAWPGSVSAAVTAGWRRIKQESAPNPHGPIRVLFDFTDPALPKSQIRMPWVGPDVVAMMTDPTYWFATTSEPGSLPTPAH